jgi:hypothetical protein
MNKKRIAFALLLLAASPAWAVNRCVGPDRQVSFQDAPCPGKGGAIAVKPASGSAPAVAAPTGQTEVQRINAAIGRSAAARRVIDLDALHIPGAARALQAHQVRCADQRRALEGSQHTYAQNLYAKTHAAQKATELVQLTLDCERQEKELQQQLSTLQVERQRLASPVDSSER